VIALWAARLLVVVSAALALACGGFVQHHRLGWAVVCGCGALVAFVAAIVAGDRLLGGADRAAAEAARPSLADLPCGGCGQCDGCDLRWADV
jgi:hypothetical protein